MSVSNVAPLRTFQLLAGHPALDLVNTLDWRFRESGPEDFLQQYRDVLEFVTQSTLISSRQSQVLLERTGENAGRRIVAATRQLREVLADIFYATLDHKHPDPATVQSVTEYFHRAFVHHSLTWKKSQPSWEWSVSEAHSEAPLWMLAWSAYNLVASSDLGNMRACGNDDCRWLFLDSSKNRTRKWCDMKLCGNRMKARRFKAQHQS